MKDIFDVQDEIAAIIASSLKLKLAVDSKSKLGAVNPEAYRSFVATGTWPDKTVMVLEVREARSKGSINQRGHFQGSDVMALEVHVKDETHFAGKWAFFEFDSLAKNGKLVPQGEPCYTCHAAHAAVDTTFVQFYPTLLPIATEKKTLSEAYLKDEAGSATGK